MEILAIIQGIVFLGFLLFLYKKQKEDKTSLEVTVNRMAETSTQTIQSLASSMGKFYESLTKLQDSHYKYLEKSTAKQLDILEKQARDFLGTMERRQDKITEFINTPKAITPIEGDKVENSIEKTPEIPEISLDQMERLPIGKGIPINVRMEGEEEIMPVNIE